MAGARATVQLRELQQQEAAVNYQKTVLKAWQEIDDALSAYRAEQQQAQELKARATRPAMPTGLPRRATTAESVISPLCSTRSAAICKRVAIWLVAKVV
jgi:hypothetical protein